MRADVAKAEAVNKAGHGLHVADSVFEAYSFSGLHQPPAARLVRLPRPSASPPRARPPPTCAGKVRRLVRALGWTNPVLPQSMYIFKQPAIGGEVGRSLHGMRSHVLQSRRGAAPPPTRGWGAR